MDRGVQRAEPSGEHIKKILETLENVAKSMTMEHVGVSASRPNLGRCMPI